MRSLIREEQRREAAEKLERELFADFIHGHPDATPAAWEEVRAEFRQRIAGLRRELDEGLEALDRGEGAVFDTTRAEDIKRRGREALAAHQPEQ